MGVLSGLEPKRVFEIFEELCAIPHGSTHTKAISDWCVEFGKKLGLEWYQDAANNVILIAPATAGYEDAPAVILQGHLDMVCEKEPDCAKDMDAEGMRGAAALDVSPLRGRTMLKIDSEVEGVFTVGCAGGSRVSCRLPLVREPFAGETMTLRISGLAGGHSGVEIDKDPEKLIRIAKAWGVETDKGRAHATVLLGRQLRAAPGAAEVRLVSAAGGSKDNAIPAAAEAVLVSADAEAVQAAVKELTESLKKEYRAADPGLTVTVEPGVARWLPMDAVTTEKAICLLLCLPNGIQAMSMDIPGLVQTSLNLGILACEEGQLSADFSVRSSLASQKQMMQERLRCLTEQTGGHVAIWGDYPAWEYLPQSPLRERMTQVYREQYGREPVIETIHAGVECGIFSEKLPGLDCVSFGPDLTDIHTPRERMHIASVQRTWALVREVLKRSK